MAHQHSPGFLKLVAEAKTRILEIAAPAVLRKLQDKSGWHLLDVREAEEYAAGRIPGAQHLCKGILERDIEAAVPDSNAEIVLYCGGGYRSALAADTLQKMGYTRVRSLAGGWRGWLEAGFPTETPAPPAL
ncbi:MAG: sulfurtransferase [Acidobacteria bacterium RIFCSPLOWO2_02_FULL_61_28]|nr:MAG: sulfurtransferase [Acidobacteria bacterium RIFCSPLOWO2_02_FULL_61_28]